MPRSREAVDAVVANVRRTQAELAVPIALEPIAALFDWPDDELDEGAFLTEILERTDALLLLDVANVYANARNRGTDPAALLDRLPLDRVAYVHVAGGAEHDGLYHDTHTDAVPQPVLDLVAELCARHRPPALMLERDGDYPPAADLRAELDAIAAASGLPERSRDRSASRAAGRPHLVAALTAGAPVPPGFDARLVEAARVALLRKRAGEVARQWPQLAAALGAGWLRGVRRLGRDAGPPRARCATAGTWRATWVCRCPPRRRRNWPPARPPGATTARRRAPAGHRPCAARPGRSSSSSPAGYASVRRG